MKTIEISCPAKINLFLSVGEFNENKKLHNINLVNQTIDLYDKIIIEKSNKFKGINIITNNDIPTDNTNSAYIACKKFYEYNNITMEGINIKIDKSIPNMAGLGGESTDAAGVLLGLNRSYNNILKNHELIYLASQIGSDVPYFIIGDYASVKGCGEKVALMNEDNPYNYYLIIKPNFSMNTKEMFTKIDSIQLKKTSYQSGILHNDFMNIMPAELKTLREFILTNYPELQHSLSGSGSAYYIASEKPILNHVKQDIFKAFPNYTIYNQKNCKKHKILIKVY